MLETWKKAIDEKAFTETNHRHPQGLFEEQINYHNLRSNRCWEICEVNGTETMRYRGPKIWEMLSPKIIVSKSLKEFKLNIKKWKPTDCA